MAFVRRTLLSLATLGTCTTAALAGHYDISFSGGGPIVIVGPSGAPWTKPYTGITGFRGGTANSADQGSNGGLGSEGPGSVTCDGRITATYTWNRDGDPNSSPPPAIVLIETASASYSAYQGSGACDDGMGDPSLPDGTGYGSGSSGVHYRLVSGPAATFSTYCTPTAHATDSVDWCTAGVQYSVQVQLITISIEGAIPANATNNCLAGQYVEGHIDAGPYVVANPSWSVSGPAYQGAVWGAWHHNSTQNGQDSQQYCDSHQWVPFDSTWAAQGSPKWFYYQSWNKSIATCAFDVYTPQGVNLGSTTASTYVFAWAPYFDFRATSSGEVAYEADSGTVTGITSGDGVGPGISFVESTGTPAFFAIDYTEGVGFASFVQLTNINRSLDYYTSTSTTTTNGQFWLDNTYPYSGWFAADSTTDHPTQNGTEDQPDEVWGNNYCVHATANDSFKMFLVWKAPVADPRTLVEDIPLTVRYWQWQADGHRSTPWSLWQPITGSVQTQVGPGWPTSEFAWDHPFVNQ